jgi:beta-galactosidase
LVPDAGALIHFSVDGAAKIIGVGNGDPSSHEPDKYFDNKWQRSLFNGKAQVIIQSNKASGEVRLLATSGSLQSASVQMNASVYK